MYSVCRKAFNIAHVDTTRVTVRFCEAEGYT
jgi:hypothetical protein